MRWLNLLILAAVAWIGYRFGAAISLNDQWPYYEALRTTTSIVFGVMGALLAIVYPEVLKGGLRGMTAVPGSNLRRVVEPLVHSALLLILLVLLAPIFAWAKGLNFDAKSTEAALSQQISFGLLCALSYWQIRILLMVLFPMDTLVSKSDDALAKSRMRRSIHTNGPG
jgi:hypothetical protein